MPSYARHFDLIFARVISTFASVAMAGLSSLFGGGAPLTLATHLSQPDPGQVRATRSLTCSLLRWILKSESLADRPYISPPIEFIIRRLGPPFTTFRRRHFRVVNRPAQLSPKVPPGLCKFNVIRGVPALRFRENHFKLLEFFLLKKTQINLAA